MKCDTCAGLAGCLLEHASNAITATAQAGKVIVSAFTRTGMPHSQQVCKGESVPSTRDHNRSTRFNSLCFSCSASILLLVHLYAHIHAPQTRSVCALKSSMAVQFGVSSSTASEPNSSNSTPPIASSPAPSYNRKPAMVCYAVKAGM